MQSSHVIQLMIDLFWTGLLLCAPVLVVTMGVGILISILQVVTQIQEMTLTFVPKLVAASLTLVICGPWMLRTLASYANRLWSDIPAFV